MHQSPFKISPFKVFLIMIFGQKAVNNGDVWVCPRRSLDVVSAGEIPISKNLVAKQTS